MLKNKNKEMTKTKHSSLDLEDEFMEQPSSPKTKSKIYDNVIWSKLANFGDFSSKSKNHNSEKHPQQNDVQHKKSKAQSTFEFLKSRPKTDLVRSEKRQTISHPRAALENGRPSSLQKQISVGSYPILLNIPEESSISRDRPATVCGDKPGAEHSKKTVAFALDRPRKNLPFKDQEASGSSSNSVFSSGNKKSVKSFTPQMTRSVSYHHENHIQRPGSYEDLDFDLEVKYCCCNKC